MSILQAVGLTVFPFIPPKIISYALGRENFRERSRALNKPSWYPPPWIFGRVWPCLYLSMGYASYLVVRDGIGEQRNIALGLYGTQMMLKTIANPLLTVYIGRPLNCLVLALLSLNVAACIRAFNPINQTAAYLMVPYLMWTSFAAFLSFNIWMRN